MVSNSFAVYWKPKLKFYLPVLFGGGLMLLAIVPNIHNGKLHFLIYNTTPSIPVGIYRLHRDADTRPISVEDIAVYPIPESVIGLVEARRYIHPKNALIKPVVGERGDYVCTEGRAVVVNSSSYGRIREADSFGRPLPWFRFCGTVEDDVIFTFINDERSFDSRHYGPIKRADIIGRATPLWTS